MKKYIHLLLFLLVPVLLNAQPYTNADKLIIVANADTLLKNYLQKSSLIEEGTTKQSDKVLREFKNLFVSDAQIFDDILPSFDSTQIYGYPYKLRTKTFKEYYSGLVYEFPEGLSINNKKININYAELDKGIIKVALERVLKGTSATRRYNLYNHDSLMLTLAIQPDKKVKIKSISAIGSPLIQVLNDKDYDGVIDSKDECPEDKGKMYLKGCPDRDGDGIPDKNDDCPDQRGEASNGGCPPSTFAYRYVFSGGIGYQLNKNAIETPTDGFGYKELDMERLNTGKVDNPGMTGGLTINGNIAYYFGKKKNNRTIGISLGISVYHYTSQYGISGYKFEYKADEDSVNSYRRIVTLRQADEDITFNIVNIPLLLKYKKKITPKLAFELGAGPGLITFLSTSDFRADMDFEGIYKYDKNTGKYFYNQHYEYETTDVLLTQNDIEKKMIFDKTANDLYASMQGRNAVYDFSTKEALSESKPTKKGVKRLGYTGNISLDLFYHVSKSMAFKVGGTFVYTYFRSKTEDYIIADESKDDYRSILESKPKSNYIGYGINVGVILGI